MDQFTESLRRMENYVNSYELQIILKELSTNQVALKASGAIPITHSVLTSVRQIIMFHNFILK